MTEEEARAWLETEFSVSRETMSQLDHFRRAVIHEASRQNLVSTSTLEAFWARHIADSAQLIRFSQVGPWLDIGSGAGLPGLVVAIITGEWLTLCEPRKRRAAFLQEVVAALALRNVRVVPAPVERSVAFAAATISARAVAPLPHLLEIGLPFATVDTTWILPKGKKGREELASLPKRWQGEFSAHASVTDPESVIIVGRNIQ